MKIALITGVTGQDGSYLAEFLLNKNYFVHGIKRKSSSYNTNRIDKIYENKKYKNNFFLHYGDLIDSGSILEIIKKVKPNEIYNLAAQSHVGVSFKIPNYTTQVNAIGTLNILDSIKKLKLEKKVKFYQASTSELFGEIQEKKQSEKTKFYPKSPYASSKLFAYWITKNYRESYNLFASNGILFNHESPIRGETFVSRKIAMAIAAIKKNKQKCLYLGNLDAKRDWGHAKDFVKGMWLMLQEKNPDDFVLATGKTYKVRTFVELAFKEIGVKIKWEGEGLKEVGKNARTNEILVRVDKKYFRPTEVDILQGDFSKAKKKLKWTPKVSFSELVKEMIKSELNNLN